MANTLLMPKATAVWLVDNTALTFDQIAKFCGLHVLEVKGIADGDVAQGIIGMDPISKGQLTRSEIEKGEADPAHELKLLEPKVKLPEAPKRRGARYTPLSRRQDRPNAILWLLRNHPELRDSEIIRLVGTTKPTINAIRDRTHWNSTNLVPQDPVGLALCSQIDLDAVVQKAAIRVERQRAAENKAAGITGEGKTLLPSEETIESTQSPDDASALENETSDLDAESVFDTAPDETSKPETDDEDDSALDADSVFAKLNALKETMDQEQPDDENPS
ncbi:MAG: DUF1013 domain-containing protein [Fimbriimonadaceae bacterium]|nr:DUF1013 domain-containing protein [Alphaproteobacteria bacterium]